MTRHATTYRSVLGPTIGRHVQLKQALGRAYALERDVLRSLDVFLADSNARDFTESTFTGWCRTFLHVTSGVRRNRMRIARNLCLYRRRTEPSCFVPDPMLFPSLHQPVRPYIFTAAEVARLLRAASSLDPKPTSPLRSQVFRLAIVLLYTMGLRRGELLRLTIGDHDPREQTLLIRESKFHKSRLLPLAADGVREWEKFLLARRTRALSVSPETPLIWNLRQGGKVYSSHGFVHVVRELFEAAGIRKPNGRFPRIHDFRHAFAVNALLRWYRAGEDVQAKLPLLATYMGHVSIMSTQHYLHFVEPLARAASERFARRYSGIVTLAAVGRGDVP